MIDWPEIPAFWPNVTVSRIADWLTSSGSHYSNAGADFPQRRSQMTEKVIQTGTPGALKQTSVADYIVQRLAAEGINHCFGVAGDYAFPLCDAVFWYGRLSLKKRYAFQSSRQPLTALTRKCWAKS
jgi:hypothetical protein